jgi:hypothetical protein
MALQVSADAVRALIPDGLYHLQGLEQRETQRLMVTLTLTSRSGGYTLQLDTTEAHILALFHHLLATAPPARPSRQRPRTVRQRTTGMEQPPEHLLATSVAPAVDVSPAAPRRTRRSRQSARGIR